jgi:hypothetical protein
MIRYNRQLQVHVAVDNMVVPAVLNYVVTVVSAISDGFMRTWSLIRDISILNVLIE